MEESFLDSEPPFSNRKQKQHERQRLEKKKKKKTCGIHPSYRFYIARDARSTANRCVEGRTGFHSLALGANSYLWQRLACALDTPTLGYPRMELGGSCRHGGEGVGVGGKGGGGRGGGEGAGGYSDISPPPARRPASPSARYAHRCLRSHGLE